MSGRKKSKALINKEEFLPEYDAKNSILTTQALEVEIDDTDFDLAMSLNGAMTPQELKKKQDELLLEKRKQIQFIMDTKKLEEAVKVMGGMQNITDIMTDPEVLSRIKDNTKTAMDLKFLSEAYSKLVDKFSTLQRLDSLDGEGTSARINIGVQFQSSDGSKTSVMVQSQ